MQTPLLGPSFPQLPISAGKVGLDTSGGSFGDNINVQDLLEALVAGTLGNFLTVIGGGKGTVQDLGDLGATETIDLANANKFKGTLDANCTIGFTGWTNGKDCQILVQTTQDGTGGWGVTFTGVSWVNGTTPVPDSAPGTRVLWAFLSDDGGTTIDGAMIGSASGSGTFATIQEVDGSPSVAASAIDVPNGSLDVAGTLATVNLIPSRGGAPQLTQTIAAAGASQTLDLSLYNTFDITLTANCTLTFSNPPDSGLDAHWTLILRQGGTGSYTVTWPGTVAWQDPTDGTTGGPAPTLWTAVGAQNVVQVSTVDGGTTYGGAFLAAGASTLEGLSDVTITSPADKHTLRYNGSVWVNDDTRWEPVTFNFGSGPELVWDGDDLVMEWKAY